MNHPIAQVVALTCYANATLRGRIVPAFFPGHSTCQFCDSVEFVRPSRDGLIDVRLTRVADTPDAWFRYLETAGAASIRLLRDPPDNVAGTDAWRMEAVQRDGRAAWWMSRWEVWSPKAPHRRIWRVQYRRGAEREASTAPSTPLALLADRFRAVLGDIRGFAESHNCGGFAASFAQAIDTIDSRGERLHGYHRDLAPDGCLPMLATCLLDACQSAWVFGGMGSWTDLAFDGAAQVEYEQVSERLFHTLVDVIQTAANASFLLT